MFSFGLLSCGSLVSATGSLSVSGVTFGSSFLASLAALSSSTRTFVGAGAAVSVFVSFLSPSSGLLTGLVAFDFGLFDFFSCLFV